MSLLDPLFAPRSIALVGASADETKLAGIVMKNLLRFRGRLYPVTPTAPEVLGHRACPDAASLPEAVDLAVIIRPANEVPEILRSLRGKARCAVIISAGFAEVGEVALQQELAVIGRESGIRLLGPNCLGLFAPKLGLDTFFLPPERLRRPKRGMVAVVSQSGAVLISLLDALAVRGTGVSRAVNYGNAVDLDAPDLFDYLTDDRESGVVVAYLESVGDGRRFAEAAQRLAAHKPLVLLKGGKGGSGGSAALSHTGRLAGSYGVFRSVMAHCGIREVVELDELIDAAHALSFGAPATGRRVCIVTNAGGPGVLAADECGRRGLALPPLPAQTARILRQAFPPFYAVGNPTDLTGQVRDREFRTVLDAVRDDYDGFLVIPLTGVAGVTLELADLLAAFRRDSGKPLVVHAGQGPFAPRLARRLERVGVPVFPSSERAVRGLASLLGGVPSVSASTTSMEGGASAPPSGLLSAFVEANPGRTLFLEHEVKWLLQVCGLPVPRGIFVPAGAPVPPAPGLSFPLVAKVARREAGGKSDVGGVVLDIGSVGELERVVARLSSIGEAEGVLMEEQAPPGVEVIVGGIVDPQFGPLVMVGLGGLFVELFRDVAFALAPLDREGARRLIARTAAARVLAGYRGRPEVDQEALVRIVVVVSELVGTGLLEEIDLNPVTLYPDGALVLDAKMSLRQSP